MDDPGYRQAWRSDKCERLCSVGKIKLNFKICIILKQEIKTYKNNAQSKIALSIINKLNCYWLFFVYLALAIIKAHFFNIFLTILFNHLCHFKTDACYALLH